MAFGWLGTFRTGQWSAYRSFVLRERADASARLAVIEAEIARIGEVTVNYVSVTDPVTEKQTCSEERAGFSVTTGSSLEKLIRAYTVMGGNPFDISLFLTPDAVYIADTANPQNTVELQPYGGVIAPLTGDPAVSEVFYKGGNLNVLKYTPARTNNQDAHDNVDAERVLRTRKWVGQIIDERVHSLEARIIKLCDLREQLEQERVLIESTVGGTVDGVPLLDTDMYDVTQTLSYIVAVIDSIFWTPTGGGYTEFTQNDAALAIHPNLMVDILPEEANTIL